MMSKHGQVHNWPNVILECKFLDSEVNLLCKLSLYTWMSTLFCDIPFQSSVDGRFPYYKTILILFGKLQSAGLLYLVNFDLTFIQFAYHTKIIESRILLFSKRM